MKLDVIHDAVRLSYRGEIPFPEVVGRLIETGVESYHVDFYAAQNRYYDGEGNVISVEQPHRSPLIAKAFDANAVAASVKKSQQGLIKYQTFIDEIAKAGCAYYVVYLTGKRVIYFGRDGDTHTEHFPKK